VRTQKRKERWRIQLGEGGGRSSYIQVRSLFGRHLHMLKGGHGSWSATRGCKSVQAGATILIWELDFAGLAHDIAVKRQETSWHINTLQGRDGQRHGAYRRSCVVNRCPHVPASETFAMLYRSSRVLRWPAMSSNRFCSVCLRCQSQCQSEYRFAQDSLNSYHTAGARCTRSAYLQLSFVVNQEKTDTSNMM
jgi:hypothetical protein